jgi:hypothetical protein
MYLEDTPNVPVESVAFLLHIEEASGSHSVPESGYPD